MTDNIKEQIEELEEKAAIQIKDCNEYDYQGQRDYDITAQDTAKKALSVINQLINQTREELKERENYRNILCKDNKVLRGENKDLKKLVETLENEILFNNK